MPGWRHWFFGFLLAAGLIGAVLHFGELEKFAQLLDQVQPGCLIVALLLQLWTYASLALAWRTVLEKSESRRLDQHRFTCWGLRWNLLSQERCFCAFSPYGCRWCPACYCRGTSWCPAKPGPGMAAHGKPPTSLSHYGREAG